MPDRAGFKVLGFDHDLFQEWLQENRRMGIRLWSLDGWAFSVAGCLSTERAAPKTSRDDVFRPLTQREQDMLPDDIHYWAKDGLLLCTGCGWTWPTGPIFLPVCPQCGWEGDDQGEANG
jgi:hypothetical protein